MASPTNAAERAMAQDIAALPPIDYAHEIQTTQTALASGRLNSSDTKYANEYLASLQAGASAAGVTVGQLNGANGNTSTAGVGDPTGDDQAQWIANLLSGGASAQVMQQAGSAERAEATTATGGAGLADWARANAGNIGMILLGVIVIAIALVASTATRNTVIKVVSKGVGVPA